MGVQSPANTSQSYAGDCTVTEWHTNPCNPGCNPTTPGPDYELREVWTCNPGFGACRTYCLYTNRNLPGTAVETYTSGGYTYYRQNCENLEPSTIRCCGSSCTPTIYGYLICTGHAWRCYYKGCPTGTHYYDPSIDKCVPVCPEGQRWCETSNSCVDVGEEPPCADQLCVWDIYTCSFSCSEPTCAEGQVYNYETCACEACPPGYCPCNNECVPCPEPRCKDALNCVWNSNTCSWDCDEPTCGTGFVWNWQTCSCIPECPDGYQWCETSGGCVEAADPACKDALNCEWDPIGCEWICDDPNAKCGNRTWNATECACTGGEAPTNLIDRRNRYHVASAAANGIRYRRSDYYVPPFALDVSATEDSADQMPAIAEDWRHRLWLLLERRGDVYECYSDDDGATWTDPELAFEDAKMPRSLVDPATGAHYRAVLKTGGTVSATIQYPGDLTPSAPFTLQTVDAANNLVDLVIDENGFDLRVARDGARRWLLTALQSNELVDLESWDDGRTWRKIVPPEEEA